MIYHGNSERSHSHESVFIVELVALLNVCVTHDLSDTTINMVSFACLKYEPRVVTSRDCIPRAISNTLHHVQMCSYQATKYDDKITVHLWLSQLYSI